MFSREFCKTFKNTFFIIKRKNEDYFLFLTTTVTTKEYRAIEPVTIVESSRYPFTVKGFNFPIRFLLHILLAPVSRKWQWSGVFYSQLHCTKN